MIEVPEPRTDDETLREIVDERETLELAWLEAAEVAG